VETIISRPRRKLPSPSVIQARIARARRLSPDQVEVGLIFLAGYDSDIFNDVMEAAETWNDGMASAARWRASQ